MKLSDDWDEHVDRYLHDKEYREWCDRKSGRMPYAAEDDFCVVEDEEDNFDDVPDGAEGTAIDLFKERTT